MTWDALIAVNRWKCGHPKTPDNTYSYPGITDKCLTCKRAAQSARSAEYGKDYHKQVRKPKLYQDLTPEQKRAYHARKKYL